MNQEFYLIKEAAAKIGVESHVLRYWEDELKMDIHRNAMGHRYYTEKDIEILAKVKDLKERGYQLKAVRDYLEKRKNQIKQTEQAKETSQAKETDQGQENNQNNEMETGNVTAIVPVKRQLMVSNEEKMKQFQTIMNKVLAQAIRENNELIGKAAGDHAADAVVTKLSGMTKEQEQRAEERFRKLDETLREMQKARAEAAASNARIDRRKRKK